jgi:hypothetical protein
MSCLRWSVQEIHSAAASATFLGIVWCRRGTTATGFEHALRRSCDIHQARQLFASEIDAATDNLAISDQQWQATTAVFCEVLPHQIVRGKRLRLLRKIESLHLNALPLEPGKVGGELR